MEVYLVDGLRRENTSGSTTDTSDVSVDGTGFEVFGLDEVGFLVVASTSSSLESLQR